jgi:hypothetical protein
MGLIDRLFGSPAPDPEPEPERVYDFDYDSHQNVGGRSSAGEDPNGRPHDPDTYRPGYDPGYTEPQTTESKEFPGGHPGSGKRR